MASVLLSLGLAVGFAALARAEVPDPRNCIADTNLVASPGGSFAYTVVLRDNGNTPIPNATVILDFNTAPGMVLCTDADPDGDGRLLGITNSAGAFTFWIKAGGNSSGRVTVSSGPDVIALSRPRTTDLDADRDVDSADRAALAALIGTSGPSGDLDKNGIVNAADQSIFEARFGHTCAITPTLISTWGNLKAVYR